MNKENKLKVMFDHESTAKTYLNKLSFNSFLSITSVLYGAWMTAHGM